MFLFIFFCKFAIRLGRRKRIASLLQFNIMIVTYQSNNFTNIKSYISVENASLFIRFLEQAFGGESLFCSLREDGSIAYAPVKIGETTLAISDASIDLPSTLNAFNLYVENVDKVYTQAIAAGASAIIPPINRNNGNRNCFVKDKFGNKWHIKMEKVNSYA